MDRNQLDDLLYADGVDVRSVGDESWMVVMHGRLMHVFISVAKDRLRVMVPITIDEDPGEDELRLALAGAFHGDARYALHGGEFYAVYLHRLSSLTTTDLRDGMFQVAELVTNFGTTFEAGRIQFEWPRPAPSTPEDGGVRRRTEEQVQEALSKQRRVRGPNKPPGSTPVGSA
ncbi:MAG: hypothetical protein JRI23_13810 [Deltaproteobacteria bacterium]|jgi:hypothetical protein|nr:hypothetical protein [Deltaproteobacteria bacterium]MBW2532805.1 hypothetical protein [Deltaproteobacteria bacterium]